MSPPKRAPAVEVRPVSAEDAVAVTALAGQLGYPSTVDEILPRLESLGDDPSHVIYVAEDPEGAVIGWVHACVRTVLIAEPQVEVAGLVVDEGHRRSGAGRALMRAAESWARSLGLSVVMLRSNVVRTEAHAFYERLGYRVMKTQKSFRKTLES